MVHNGTSYKNGWSWGTPTLGNHHILLGQKGSCDILTYFLRIRNGDPYPTAFGRTSIPPPQQERRGWRTGAAWPELREKRIKSTLWTLVLARHMSMSGIFHKLHIQIRDTYIYTYIYIYIYICRETCIKTHHVSHSIHAPWSKDGLHIPTMNH